MAIHEAQPLDMGEVLGSNLGKLATNTHVYVILAVISGNNQAPVRYYDGSGHFGPFKACRYTANGLGGNCKAGNAGFKTEGKDFFFGISPTKKV